MCDFHDQVQFTVEKHNATISRVNLDVAQLRTDETVFLNQLKNFQYPENLINSFFESAVKSNLASVVNHMMSTGVKVRHTFFNSHHLFIPPIGLVHYAIEHKLINILKIFTKVPKYYSFDTFFLLIKHGYNFDQSRKTLFQEHFDYFFQTNINKLEILILSAISYGNLSALKVILDKITNNNMFEKAANLKPIQLNLSLETMLAYSLHYEHAPIFDFIKNYFEKEHVESAMKDSFVQIEFANHSSLMNQKRQQNAPQQHQYELKTLKP